MLYVIKWLVSRVCFYFLSEAREIIVAMNSGSSHARHFLLNYIYQQFVSMPENKPIEWMNDERESKQAENNENM